MAKLKVDFSIQSVEDKADSILKVKEAIPIDPDKFWKKGDSIITYTGQTVNSVYKYGRWGIEENYESVRDIKEGIIPILDRIWPYKEIIYNFRYNFNLEIILTVIPTISDFKPPAFGITQDILSKLVYLGADIDFDIYFD